MPEFKKGDVVKFLVNENPSGKLVNHIGIVKNARATPARTLVSIMCKEEEDIVVDRKFVTPLNVNIFDLIE